MPMSPKLLRPRASGAFTPLSISGLALWLDGADTATLGNTSSGAGGASANGPIKFWGDKSGNSRNATNDGADSVCPTLLSAALNGKSALGFDGGDFLTGALSLTLTAQTVFAVGRLETPTGGFARLFTQSDAGNDFNTTGHYIPLLRNSTSNDLGSFAGGGMRATVSVNSGAWFVVSSQHTGAVIENRLNNGTAATFSHTLNKSFTNYRLGATLQTVDAATWRDRLAEVIVYSRYVSAAERNAISKYLGNKWGITVS